MNLTTLPDSDFKLVLSRILSGLTHHAESHVLKLLEYYTVFVLYCIGYTMRAILYGTYGMIILYGCNVLWPIFLIQVLDYDHQCQLIAFAISLEPESNRANRIKRKAQELFGYVIRSYIVGAISIRAARSAFIRYLVRPDQKVRPVDVNIIQRLLALYYWSKVHIFCQTKTRLFFEI